jgi:hypothetical protein
MKSRSIDHFASHVWAVQKYKISAESVHLSANFCRNFIFLKNLQKYKISAESVPLSAEILNFCRNLRFLQTLPFKLSLNLKARP